MNDNTLKFIKYSATGNDFVVIDNREQVVDATDIPLFSRICERKTGIGADGVLLLEQSDKYDFRMRYLNSDGGEVDMCGNGARTIATFARHLQIPEDCGYTAFETNNGVYTAYFMRDGSVQISMSELYDIGKIDVSDIAKKYGFKGCGYMNTGVPHLIAELGDSCFGDFKKIGSEIRHDSRFTYGVNVNFLKVIDDYTLDAVTYERGVEDLTLACGTGATACALHHSMKSKVFGDIRVIMPGGELLVGVEPTYKETTLCGKVEKIFEGYIER